MGDQAHRPSEGRHPGRLILVKHGQPAIVPDVPRSQWALSEAGRVAAVALAEKLAAFAPTALFASSEPKARDTAQAMGEILGLPVVCDPDFAEHRADHNPFVSPAEIEALIIRALRAPDALVMGEETGAAARARFDAALDRVITMAGTPIVVAHGRVISLWLGARLGIDPVPLWRALDFTCAAVLSEDGRAFDLVDWA